MDMASAEALLRPVEMSPEEKDLRAWLKDCKDILADRAPTEIGELAILVGFDRSLVYKVLSYFCDAMNGTHIEGRVALKAYQFEAAVERVQSMDADLKRVPELDLMPLWKEVHTYQTGAGAR